MVDVSSIETRLQESGQSRLANHLQRLDESAKQRLAEQIDEVDLQQIRQLWQSWGKADGDDWASLARQAQPPRAIRPQHKADASADDTLAIDAADARQRGEAALSAGQIGVLLVAGGQGSRLGFDKPKGMYAIGPVSNASLFQIHLEKILATARRYQVSVPLYLMTSPATHEDTIEFLQSRQYFGMPEEDVHIFCQGTMPAVDAETGHLLLAEKDQLFMSPDGHGGTVGALAKSGAASDAQWRGIRHLFYFQVDNPLTPVCDPELIGYHLLAESELSSVAVAKESPGDKVGNFVMLDGRLRVIEYIDFPDEVAGKRAGDGSLVFWAGNTAIHVFDVAFLQRVLDLSDALPFHIQHKKVPFLNEAGERVEPSSPNALKFERFIFDLLPQANNAIVIEADEEQVFAPLKNASGAPRDTPEFVRDRLVAVYRNWLQEAGVNVADGVKVEISPLFALDAQQVRERLNRGLVVESDTYFSLAAKA